MSGEALDEKVVARGLILELVQMPQPDGRVFEKARRAPGVRLIIADKVSRKVLLTKEFRRELSDWDYRLPGGKVFDSLNDFEEFRATGGDITKPATKKVIEESAEEAGIKVNDLELFAVSTLGTTVEWDLYVFESTDWSRASGGQQLGVGENIEADKWFTYDDTIELIMNGDMKEERIALILLRWIHKQKAEE